jgi:threonine synthase
MRQPLVQGQPTLYRASGRDQCGHVRLERLIVRYISTRGEAEPLGFEDVVLAGLARDGGLYVPESWPRLSPAVIAALAGRPFADIAVAVMRPFVGGAIADDMLAAMARAAYAGFGHAAVTPLVQLDERTFVLELFHGPTLAFKDVAMQLLARLMDLILERRGERATIVGATSGDTGGAAIEAFRGSSRVDVVILYPDGRVSDVQRRMMTTPTEPNVHAVAIDGTFDDCQALVKAMFNHLAFRDRVRLAGVNSINWARIVAQTSYYFAAATALGSPDRRVVFSVPTGNFGDILAGFVARRMGLPIERLVIASNANDILPRALESGAYEMQAVMATSSPSMDIQVSSNFERFLFEGGGRDAGLVRRQMLQLGQSRRFDLSPGQLAAARAEFAAHAAAEDEVRATIRDRLARSGYLLDPHSACGVAAAERAPAPPGVPRIVLATASPAKFPDAMAAVTGARPALPARLGRLMTAPERITRLANDIGAVERLVASLSRAAREGRA